VPGRRAGLSRSVAGHPGRAGVAPAAAFAVCAAAAGCPGVEHHPERRQADLFADGIVFNNAERILPAHDRGY